MRSPECKTPPVGAGGEGSDRSGASTTANHCGQSTTGDNLAVYQRAATEHRPGEEGLRREAKRLAAAGLKARDIAQALRLPLDQVQTWLGGGA